MLDRKGFLSRPVTLLEALERRAQLVYECRKIEKQLHESTPPQRADYDDWKQRAEEKLRKFRVELQLHQAVIERRKDVETLLREAWKLLRALENDIDFEPHESATVRKLDRYFDEEKP